MLIEKKTIYYIKYIAVLKYAYLFFMSQAVKNNCYSVFQWYNQFNQSITIVLLSVSLYLKGPDAFIQKGAQNVILSKNKK